MLKFLQSMQTSSAKVGVKEHEELQNRLVVELDDQDEETKENLV